MAMKLLLTLGLVFALYFVAAESRSVWDRRKNVLKTSSGFGWTPDASSSIEFRRRRSLPKSRRPQDSELMKTCLRNLDLFNQVCVGDMESPRCTRLLKNGHALLDIMDKQFKDMVTVVWSRNTPRLEIESQGSPTESPRPPSSQDIRNQCTEFMKLFDRLCIKEPRNSHPCQLLWESVRSVSDIFE